MVSDADNTLHAVTSHHQVRASLQRGVVNVARWGGPSPCLKSGGNDKWYQIRLFLYFFFSFYTNIVTN